MNILPKISFRVSAAPFASAAVAAPLSRNSVAFACLLCGLCLLLLSSCSSGPAAWTRPPVELPAQWESTATGNPGQLSPWWRNFQDPQLDTLIDEAFRRNADLAVAAIRLRRAQLQAGYTDSNQLPGLSASVATSATRNYSPPVTSRSTVLSATLSYEVDLWGRLALQRDVARWEVEATAADCQAAALGIAGTVAGFHWELAYLNRLLANSQAGIEYSRRTLDIVRARYQAGAVSGGDLAQAEQVLASRLAAHTNLEQQRTSVRHALAIVFDRQPSDTVAERKDLPATAVPAVDAGLPAALLAHRPDLRAAETRLRSAYAGQDLTRLSFYPSFSLTGTLGSSSEGLANALKNPATTLGAGLVLPFLQGRESTLAVQISATQYEEAVVNFRQRLFTALAEVEDRLAARTQLIREAEHLGVAEEQARLAERHAETRYRAGATAAQLWLDTQQTLRNTEDLVALNRYKQLVNQVSLYQALGGDATPVAQGCQRPVSAMR